jgi:D-aminopeptidase
VARTGVTVVLPVEDPLAGPVPAGGAVLNGAGECTGFLQMQEWGVIGTPVFLTSTMQVGRVYDAACQLITDAVPGIGEQVVIPVVAECDDSFLSEVRRMQVDRSDVAAAWQRAAASVGSAAAPAEGAVGAGTGMTCFEFKGGIGTASRVTSSGHTVGVLLLSNFGRRQRLTVAGVPVGQLLAPEQPSPGPSSPAGSCIVVVVTDAPLDSAACVRLARRAGLGLARTGSTASHGSGEIFLGLATGLRGRHSDVDRSRSGQIEGSDLDEFFAAVVEATEEAVLNSMLAAPTVTGRDGNTSPCLPVERVRELLGAAGNA